MSRPKVDKSVKISRFVIFTDNAWEIISLPGTEPEELVAQRQFVGTNHIFSISSKQSYHYLYLNSNTQVEIGEKVNSEISIIIKQSFTDLFSVRWPTNILWEGKQQHIMSQYKNSMDLIKLYPLPESQHLLGKIIAQNFNY